MKYFVTFNMRAIGKEIAKNIVEKEELDKVREDRGARTIEFLMGSPDDDASLFLFNGIMEVLQEYIDDGTLICRSGRVTFDETSIMDQNTDTAKKQLKSEIDEFYSLEKTPDIICTASDDFALAALELLEKEYDMNSPEGKTAFHKEAAKRLTMFEEEIERNNYIEAVAEKYRIGYEELKKLVGKMAIQMGQATPAERPKQTANREKQKEDGNLKSQKILLTWLIENEALFAQIKKYIVPEDFTKELYRTVAEILYEQYEAGEVNPAKVMNHFTDEEEHREVAELFHTKIRELTTKEEQEKALKETIIRVKYNSIEFATKMLNPTDIVGLQRLMEAKKSLQDLQKMHISID